uniref:Uncharacterized protein n=1 Tax=Anguilla anguilla TaxID=7936 RepID=A0A0E9XKV7_ANGAN
MARLWLCYVNIRTAHCVLQCVIGLLLVRSGNGLLCQRCCISVSNAHRQGFHFV